MTGVGIILCFYLQVIQIFATGSFCQQDYRTGLMLTNTSIFRSQRHNTLSSCLKSCIATASCVAFTFNRRDLMCLYGGTGSEFESTTDLDYVTSPNQWQPVNDEVMIHPCTHSTCQSGSECYVKHDEITLCINTECTDSSCVANSSSLSYERTVGVTVEMVCDDGFILNGNPQMTCQGDGQWTTGAICFECTSVSHYTTYSRAKQHCESTGSKLLQLENTSTLLPHLLNFTKARCVTCPGDLVADQHIRYMEDDCLPNTDYTDFSACTCHFTTAVPGKKIKIQSVFLDLEDGFDYLWIFDGGDASFPVLGSYTGSTTFSLVTSGGDALVYLLTDAATTKTGFRLSYSMVDSDIQSSTTISVTKPDNYYYIWMEGYINVANSEFIPPNGPAYDLSDWTLEATDTRLCYDPSFDFIDAFTDTDYCHTFCESP